MTQRLRTITLAPLAICCGILTGLAGCNGEESEAKKPAEEESTQSGGEETPTTDSREGWPTEQEAIDTILKVERAIRASPANREIYYITDLRHEVHSVTFGENTLEKWMDTGIVTTYPARIVYTRITEHSNAPADVEECGADGTWWLYRDAFGQWTGRYSAN
jgi:hypothetical protein